MSDVALPPADPVDGASAHAMRWIDLPLALLGQRRAILGFVDARDGLLFTAVLVLSAALAREYDGVSLLHQPSELLGPFAASLILATILFVVIQACRKVARAPDISLVHDYRRLLVGYWLTAPLAWLYAIPVEAFASELFSVKFNLTLLAIVSVWRVVLFARIASVITGLPFLISLSWIGVVTCVIALVALVQASIAITGIMGGLRLTESEEIMLAFQNGASQVVFFAGILFAFFWVMSFLLLWQSRPPVAAPLRESRIATSTWGVAALAFVALGVGLWQFQPNLIRAADVDRMLKNGDMTAAIDYMERHTASDFPRQWDPPPRKYQHMYTEPQMAELISAIGETEPPTWIVELLLVGAPDALLSQNQIYGWGGNYHFENFDPEKLRAVLRSLRTLWQMDGLRPADRERADQLIEQIEQAIVGAEERARARAEALPTAGVSDSAAEQGVLDPAVVPGE